MVEIFSLTPMGHALARSTTNPDTLEWRIIHHLDLIKSSTKDSLASHCGVGTGSVSAALYKLRHKRVVVEETGSPV